MNEALWLILALVTKHFVVDFPLQTQYQWSNKGTYGHPGGMLHASLHGIGTYLSFVWYAPMAAVYLCLADTVIHYHIDWAKVKLNTVFGWAPNTHDQFWWLLGLDQYLHVVTYVVFVSMVVV